jgi:hypothetical protein
MAETSGGLRKISIQFTPAQMAWLRDRSEKKGRVGIAVVVREIAQEAMNAEQRAGREAVS